MKLEDRHALMEAVMRLAPRRYLRNAGVVDAEFFAKQGARFVTSEKEFLKVFG